VIREFARIVVIHYAEIVDFAPGIVQINIVNVQIPGIMRMMRTNESANDIFNEIIF